MGFAKNIAGQMKQKQLIFVTLKSIVLSIYFIKAYEQEFHYKKILNNFFSYPGKLFFNHAFHFKLDKGLKL